MGGRDGEMGPVDRARSQPGVVGGEGRGRAPIRL